MQGSTERLIVKSLQYLYSSQSEFEACAERPDPKWGVSGDCTPTLGDRSGDRLTCCWFDEPKWYEDQTQGEKYRCQTCHCIDIKGKQDCDCTPVETIDYGRPVPEITLPEKDELPNPDTGQTPQPTATLPSGDIFTPPGQAADPGTGQNTQPPVFGNDGTTSPGEVADPDEDKKPTGTTPGKDVFNPPGEVADPGEDKKPTGTTPRDDIFVPPGQAADPSTSQNSNDDNGNKGGGVGRPDIGATGPEIGEVKPNLPSTGDGGSGVVN